MNGKQMSIYYLVILSIYTILARYLINNAFKYHIFVQFPHFAMKKKIIRITLLKFLDSFEIPVDTTSRTYFLTNEQKKDLDKCKNINRAFNN